MIKQNMDKKEINILLLGETGSGKSTTINSLINYLAFADFADALDSLDKFKEVIPTKFMLFNTQTGKSETITSGAQNRNERLEIGKSCTISPFAYTFTFEKTILRIIDSPGVGDTDDSSKNDKNHFDQTLMFLQHLKVLHGIVFVVSGSTNRSTTFFKYCITELLLHLTKDVLRNVAFCFTSSRDSFFGPGDSFGTLENFFAQLDEANIKMNAEENCFFIDNDVYRFMVTKKHKENFPFNVNRVNSYKESWLNSCRQLEAMIRYIVRLPPYNLAEMFTLNNVRKIVMQIAVPTVQIQLNISENIAQINEHKEKWDNFDANVNNLKGSLNFEVHDLDVRELASPATVCINCVEVVNDKIRYRCCEVDCWCIYVTPNIPNQFMLRLCHAMNWKFDCTQCGCSFRAHMHRTYEEVVVKRSAIRPEVKTQIENNTSQIEQIKETINVLEKLKDEYEQELVIVQDVIAKLFYLIQKSSSFKQNDFFEKYFDFLINEENIKSNSNSRQLMQMKQNHLNSVAIVSKANATKLKPEEAVNFGDVGRLKEKLLNLKHSGASFRNIIRTAELIGNKKMKHHEKNVLTFKEIRHKTASSWFE